MCLQETLLAAAFIRAIRSKPNSLMLQKNTAKAQRGIVMPLTAVALLTLIGFMGLALDVGYVYMVRNQLQNAADAAALAGAGHIFSSTASTPNFTVASAAASNAIINLNNTAANAPLVTGTITTGYWSLSGSPSGLHATPLGNQDFPAVEVDITKNGANGAVNAFFSQVLGITSFNPMARAVAVITGPGQANVFPMAISDCLFNNYWNASTNSPKLATSTSPLPNQTLPQTIGQPYVFEIESAYHAVVCSSGQWTSYNLSPPSTATMKSMIDGTQTQNIAIGTSFNTILAPGSKTALYNATAGCSSGGGSPSCAYVLVAVVSDSAIGSGNTTPIQALACIHIITAVGGSGKYIEAQMVPVGNPNCIVPGGSGFGNINYGALQPPRLVNYQGNTYTPFD